VLRCGCLAALAAALALLALVAAVAWFATRADGPAFSNGIYTVKLAGGVTRVDRITPEAAASFADKAVPPKSPFSAAKLQLLGVDFSEEEVNSELAQQLASAPISGNGFNVDRIFIELHPAATRAYIYGRFHGQRLVLSSHVAFSVADGVGQVTLSDAKLGKLPLGALWPLALNWSGNSKAVEQRLAVTLPPEVSQINPGEGSLHVTVQLQKAFTSAARVRPSSYSAITSGGSRKPCFSLVSSFWAAAGSPSLAASASLAAPVSPGSAADCCSVGSVASPAPEASACGSAWLAGGSSLDPAASAVAAASSVPARSAATSPANVAARSALAAVSVAVGSLLAA
jgi:hypothetical protein